MGVGVLIAMGLTVVGLGLIGWRALRDLEAVTEGALADERPTLVAVPGPAPTVRGAQGRPALRLVPPPRPALRLVQPPPAA